MGFLSKILSGLKWFGRLFTSSIAKEAFELADSIVPVVLPVVSEIRKIVPDLGNATINDIKRAYAAFGQVLGDIKMDKAAFGTALAELALTVARTRVPDANMPTRIIKFAIEAALLFLKGSR